MTKRREIETQLALYSDLTGIIGAMRSFAMVELKRIGQRETAQHQAMQAMNEALQDMASALPYVRKTAGDIWLLFGSVRGFCGSFNEDIRHAWHERGGNIPVIAVGERLTALLPEDKKITAVPGATGALDTSETIDRILAAIGQIRTQSDKELGLVAVIHDEKSVTVQHLLPLSAQSAAYAPLPLTNESPEDVGDFCITPRKGSIQNQMMRIEP